jgi:hypothetical protein
MIRAKSEALADGRSHAGSRDLDGPEAVGTHVLGSRLQNGPGILRGARSGCHDQNGDEVDVIPSFSLW